MQRFQIFVTVAVLVLLTTVSSTQAADMRGFGTVQETVMPGGQGMKFTCDSPAHATLLIHKLIRDMAATATIPSIYKEVQLSGRTVPVLVRPGLGAYLVLAQGSEAYCFTAPLAPGQETGDLAPLFADAASLVPGAQLYDATYTYPVYLDKFSSAGIGTWYTLYGPFGDDPSGLKDIVDPHFQYLTENKMAVHLMNFGVSNQETERFLHEYQRPYHIARWHEWDTDIERLDPFDLIQPGNVFTGYSDYYTGISFGGEKLQNYREWDFQNFMQPYINDPLLVDWDEAHGEISPQYYLSYNDYGPENRAHFVKWLQTDMKYTLASLGLAWHHNANYFTSWSQVPIPWNYDLFGAEPDSVFANHTWHLHTAELAVGVAAGYSRAGYDDSRWPSLPMPGGELGQLAIQAHKHLWFRGTMTVPAAYLAAHRGAIYLEVATLAPGGGQTNPDHVWLDGSDLGALSASGGGPTVGSKNVSGIVHAGINQIAYSPAQDAFPGTFLLATKPMEVYPYADSGLNARYVDWMTYYNAAALEEVTRTVKTIRGNDPNRPIKVMAVQPKDLFSPVMAEYGCFTHNTGDEAFFYPWDKRLAYPYGYRADAESSGSMLDPAIWKRWFGWFTFSGLNAFDNFIDVEVMMYPPAVAPLWKANFPYLHLANRYDMKKPEIGLLWSGPNGRLAPGGHSALPFCWDLSRGDIQPLGYSYALFDEPGLHRHLADGYKVLWDEGTYVMSKETVADIRHFVEQGGTYVALAETGRNTLTQKDAWPIEALSGFHVKEIRPLGGFVSILNDQPLFTKLAGQNFENYGRSIDYSSYNYADKCTALEAVAPGTQAIARYRDGAIAIGMRTLGKGRVVVLGSPFWRDSYDQAGVWHPSAAQETFIQDLLTGLGVPPDVPTEAPTPVWRDRYIATNGTEEYLLLFNPGATDTQTVTANWPLSFPASQVFDPKTGLPYPATITGQTAQVSVTLAPYETKILAVQSGRPPADSVNDWFGKLASTWQGTAPGHKATRPDLPEFYAPFPQGYGKVVDTASVTPERLDTVSTSPDAEDGWDTRLNSIRPFYAGVTVAPNQSVIYRRTVTVPASWKPGDIYRLRLKQFQSDFQGVVYLNGKQVATGQDVAAAQVGQYQNDGIDVTSAIRFPGPNVLVIDTNADGFAGEADLWRQPAPLSTVSLAGEWSVQATEDSGKVTATLPGTVSGILATKTVIVPALWSKSHVYLRLGVGPNGLPGHIAVNNKVFFYETETPDYLDVTPWIKFGQPNTVLLESANGLNGWAPGNISFKSAQFEQVRPQ